MAEVDDIRRKIAAREKKPGYVENVEQLKKRLAELEKQQGE